jgi:FKBP-type peptidyl-prolyl cis-trans isomerase FklB
MKQLVLAACILFAAFTNLSAQTKTIAATHASAPAATMLKTSLDSFSYAIGLSIGKNLKQTGIDSLNYSLLQKGMVDQVKGKPAELNDQQTMSIIQQKMQVYSANKLAVEKAKGDAFLAANKQKPGVMSLADGIQYVVITKGTDTSASPTAKDTVVTNYIGTLIDGKEFDNSYKRGKPITFPVSGVIKGWTEILQLMHIGDKWRVFIPSDLGYGDRGAGANIPGGSALIFDMELIDVKHPVAASATPSVPAPAPAQAPKQ